MDGVRGRRIVILCQNLVVYLRVIVVIIAPDDWCGINVNEVDKHTFLALFVTPASGWNISFIQRQLGMDWWRSHCMAEPLLVGTAKDTRHNLQVDDEVVSGRKSAC